MSSPPTALQFLETEDPTETPLQNPVSAADTSSPQLDVNTEQNAQKQPSLPRPILIYTRDQLLFLSKSPLVKAPPDMPDLKHWYGYAIPLNSLISPSHLLFFKGWYRKPSQKGRFINTWKHQRKTVITLFHLSLHLMPILYTLHIAFGVMLKTGVNFHVKYHCHC